MCIPRCIERLCCDPHKLTYVAAIFSIVEAVIFGTINLVLILVSKCVIPPPDERLGAGLDRFYSWYFFSNESCYDYRGSNYTIPDWVTDEADNYLIPDRPQHTSVEANLNYQITYLSMHAAWILFAIILIYGNARKLWGYYIPWLLVSLTFIVMDVTIAAFFIVDIKTVSDNDWGNFGPMIWGFSLYLRGFVFYFSNLGHTASATNAFCKSHHKRTKQERQKKKMEKKHAKELEEAKAAAAKEARAEVLREHHM